MIDKQKLLSTILDKVHSIEIGMGLDLRTYKRDRGAFIYKEGEDSFTVVEEGYQNSVFSHFSVDKLMKLMRTIDKREFPRSSKIRFYTIHSLQEITAPFILESIIPVVNDKNTIFCEIKVSYHDKELFEKKIQIYLPALQINYEDKVCYKGNLPHSILEKIQNEFQNIKIII